MSKGFLYFSIALGCIIPLLEKEKESEKKDEIRKEDKSKEEESK